MDIINEATTWLANSFWVLLAIPIAFVVGRWAARKFRDRLHRSLVAREAAPSLINLSDTVAPYVIWFLVFLVVLYLLGVPINSVLFAAAIVIALIGIAMRESIGNFSATVNFWLFRPFEAGDYIKTGSSAGTVQEIELFNTVIHARDNKVHVLPNSKILNDGLVNYSKKDALRVDLLFGIGYDDDVSKAKEILAGVLAADDRVLQDPAPGIFVQNLGDSSVDIAVRPYVTLENYWGIQSAIREEGKYQLEANGFESPNPQYDIHLDESSQN